MASRNTPEMIVNFNHIIWFPNNSDSLKIIKKQKIFGQCRYALSGEYGFLNGLTGCYSSDSKNIIESKLHYFDLKNINGIDVFINNPNSWCQTFYSVGTEGKIFNLDLSRKENAKRFELANFIIPKLEESLENQIELVLRSNSLDSKKLNFKKIQRCMVPHEYLDIQNGLICYSKQSTVVIEDIFFKKRLHQSGSKISYPYANIPKFGGFHSSSSL